jgi:hypothetical protein
MAGYDLEDIHTQLVGIQSEIRASSESRRFVILWWMLLLFGGLIFDGGIAKLWHTKTRYAIQYGVNYDQVYMNDRPHDCNFLHAPLGDKDCHYEIKVSEAQGQKDGSTEMEKQIYIFWEKVED